ncbi:MAG: hypothetical protein A2Z72_02795 [Omnitrophica bacterium RBG_13_46_9]|nr:MAG: hypothetical protein A2Z72_02795 [Omnitrophica bacterium RBG_13_46_9]
MDKAIKVLVVDDEADFRQVMTVWLKSKGYLVITAPDGEHAIEAVKKEKPDIVFMDLRMPVMDGSDTIKKIRQFDKDTPIIIISAYLDDPKIKEVKTSYISGIFNKRDDFDKGLNLLECVLRTHKRFKDRTCK